MPTYKSTFEFWADGETTITRDIFVISDTYAGLASYTTATEVDNDIFDWANTKSDLDGASGEFLETELELQVDETRAVTANDFNALAFFKDAQDITVKRFVGRLINPNTPLQQDDWDFRGRIVAEM